MTDRSEKQKRGKRKAKRKRRYLLLLYPQEVRKSFSLTYNADELRIFRKKKTALTQVLTGKIKIFLKIVKMGKH